jgi:hypothetical protein
MKYTSAALRKLLADNGIIKSGYTGKLELLLIAHEAGLISREDVVPPKKQKDEPKKRGRPRKYPPKEVDPNKTVSPMYLRLRAIRHNPKTVTITNVETYKMNTQTVKQLREAAKSRGVRGYYAMRKADLIAALTSLNLQLSASTTTVIDPFAGFDTWANEQLNKPAVNKSTSTSWNDWLTEHVPIPSGFNEWADEQLAKPIKKAASIHLIG